ncbi:MAG: Transglutaminase-like superfamily protein [Rhodocyclales bacterium]|nr:Transglutaminase-like superfamily protein [Rhodocyclales bacterium]
MHAKIESFTNAYAFEATGLYTNELDIVIRVLSPEGARDNSREQISYNTSLQSMDILVAETVKASGQVLPVKPDAINTQSGQLGAITRQDAKIVVITFPSVAPGDAVHYRIRMTQTQLELPGRFFELRPLSDNVIWNNVVITASLPEQLEESFLHIFSKGLRQSGPSIENGRRVWSWRYESKVASIAEANEVDGVWDRPHLMLSNAGSWRDVAEAYASLHRPKVRVTERVRKLAAEIVVPGSTTDMDKVRLVQDWVRHNIRYVATYIGPGGFEPHDVEWILDHRYGDCKDHVVMMEALLRALDVESTPALINAGTTTYSLPAAPSPYAFNHVINYVPSIKRYVDATAERYPFGYLPTEDAGKPVLQVYGDGSIAYTPAVTSQQRRVKRTTRIDLRGNGSATRETDIEALGLAAVQARVAYNAVEPAQRTSTAVRQLFADGLQGSATQQMLADNGTDRFVQRIQQEIDELLPPEEFTSFTLRPANTGPISAFTLLNSFIAKARSHAMLCEPLHVEDHYVITLEKGVSALKLPRDRMLEESGVRYAGKHSIEGNVVTVDRVFDWSPSSTVCTAKQYLTLLPLMRKVAGFYTTGLLVQRDIPE